MELSTLQKLHCPYCTAGFQITKAINADNKDVINGIVSCNCGDNPIVEGILVLNIMNQQLLEHVLSDIIGSAPEKALCRLLSPMRTRDRLLISLLAQGRIIPGKVASKIDSSLECYHGNKVANCNSFSKIIDTSGVDKGYGAYLKYRFSSASFIASIPLILTMNDFDGDILDIGCGTGQAAFIISQLYPERRLTLADFSFVNLYLTKRFCAPNSEFICLDANNPLPFGDKSFKTIFSMDAIHYVYSKGQLMREIFRISSDDYIAIFSHLHNKYGKDPAKGFALGAEGWKKLVPFLHGRMFSEGEIFENFFKENKLDLANDFSIEDSEDINAFSVVATSREDVFRVYKDIGDLFFNTQRHLIISPLYKILDREDKIILKKWHPSDYFQSENKVLYSALPETVVLGKELWREIKEAHISEANKGKVIELMKKFILINTPQNY